MASMKWSTDKEQGLLSYDIQLRSHLAIHSVVSLKLAAAWLVLSLVNCYGQSSSCKARGAASSGLFDRGRGEEKTRPSVRPSVAVLQHFSSTRVFSSINVMLEMSFVVVFTVSSSVQSIPNAVRAASPPNSPYSRSIITLSRERSSNQKNMQL